MKVIVDNDFPPLDDIRCLALRMELYKRKRKYGYKERKDGAIYIYFPRVNPLVWIYQHIKFYLWSKYHVTEEHVSEDEFNEDN